MRVSTRSLALACLLHAPLIPLAAQQLTATTRADWDSAFVANLKLAAAPQSDFLFYRRLRRFVAVLGDGQAAVIPAPSLRSRIARPPLLVQSVERRSFILDYAENDEMRVARPERLGEIL